MSERIKKLGLFAFFLGLIGAFSVGIYHQQGQSYQTLGSTGEINSSATNALFVHARNADDVAHEVGDVVVWSDGTYDGLDVTTTTTANDGLVAGVVAINDIAASGYGLVQISGYHSAVTIGVANSAGDSLVTSTTGEAAGVYSVAQATGTAANQARTAGVFAVALEATTSSTTVKAILK